MKSNVEVKTTITLEVTPQELADITAAISVTSRHERSKSFSVGASHLSPILSATTGIKLNEVYREAVDKGAFD